MGVSIQRYADVCVAHDVLQCFGVHPRFCHIGTEGVSAHMRGYFRHLDAVNLVILLDNKGAVDKPYPIFKLRDKIEEKTGWDGYDDTDRR